MTAKMGCQVFIGFGNDDNGVGVFGQLGIAFHADADNDGAAGLDFLQVADGFVIDGGLVASTMTDTPSSIRPGCRVSVRRQHRLLRGCRRFPSVSGAFQGYGVVQGATQEEGVFTIAVIGGKGFNLVHMVQDIMHLFRHGQNA